MGNTFYDWLEGNKACTPGMEWVQSNTIDTFEKAYKYAPAEYLFWGLSVPGVLCFKEYMTLTLGTFHLFVKVPRIKVFKEVVHFLDLAGNRDSPADTALMDVVYTKLRESQEAFKDLPTYSITLILKYMLLVSVGYTRYIPYVLGDIAEFGGINKEDMANWVRQNIPFEKLKLEVV